MCGDSTADGGPAEPRSEGYHGDSAGYDQPEQRLARSSGPVARSSGPAEPRSEGYHGDGAGYLLERDSSGKPIFPRDPATGEVDFDAVVRILANSETRADREIPAPPGGWLPARSVADRVRPRSPPGEKRDFQVNVRLSEREHRRLKEAAALYGVHRTTFARMLINRGAGAIVDEERRHAVAFSSDAE